MRLATAILLMLLGPLTGPAVAHPHVFIDTGFGLVFDEAGRLSAVRVEWAYDEFYSLLMIEEYGLDADGDGIPEPERLGAFAGRDVDWSAGFPGDFSVTVDGTEVALAPPDDHAASWREGRYVTTHVRPLAAPLEVTGRAVVARSYDPTYFVAYDVPEEPQVIGRDDCRLTREAADRAAAEADYGDALAAIDTSGDPFEVVDLPDIGILFADAYVLACSAPS